MARTEPRPTRLTWPNYPTRPTYSTQPTYPTRPTRPTYPTRLHQVLCFVRKAASFSPSFVTSACFFVSTRAPSALNAFIACGTAT